MKGVLLALGIMFAMGVTPVGAEEYKLITVAKAIVDAVDPSIEYGVFMKDTDIGRAEGFTGLAGTLYSYAKDGDELAALRLGVMIEANHAVYVTVQANGVNLIKRYAPETVKAVLSPGGTDRLWTFLADHGKIGIGPGFDAETQRFGAVATAGIGWTF